VSERPARLVLRRFTRVQLTPLHASTFCSAAKQWWYQTNTACGCRSHFATPNISNQQPAIFNWLRVLSLKKATNRFFAFISPAETHSVEAIPSCLFSRNRIEYPETGYSLSFVQVHSVKDDFTGPHRGTAQLLVSISDPSATVELNLSKKSNRENAMRLSPLAF